MKNTLHRLLNSHGDERKQLIDEQGNELLDQMLKHIGTTDYELRDDLNYNLFSLLLSENLLTNEQMATLTFSLISNDYLFYAIGEKETDSVFTRSFSALWLSHLISLDARQHFLTEDEASRVFRTCITYISKEKDVRGFVDEKGWAYAISHGSKLYNAIIHHPSFQQSFAPILLQGIKDSFWKGKVFIDDEDEQLAQTFFQLILQNIPEDLFIEWVEQVFDQLNHYLYLNGYDSTYFTARTNTLHFMKTLYFILKFSQKTPELQGVISIFIGRWMNQ